MNYILFTSNRHFFLSAVLSYVEKPFPVYRYVCNTRTINLSISIKIQLQNPKRAKRLSVSACGSIR